TLSWTVNATTLKQAEAQLTEGDARGYRHFNFKIGPPQTPDFDLSLAQLIRNFAPNGFCWADANTGYDLDTALSIAPKLADIGVDVLESPLPPMQITGYQSLRRQGALPIVMDEGVISPLEAEMFMELGMMDGLTLKVGRTAGLWAGLEMARLARERGIFLLGSGLCDPDLSLAGSVHLFAWAGIDRPCALNGPQYLAETLDTSGFISGSGRITVPTGPGLGLCMASAAEQALQIVAEVGA
ncbi:MAG: hypothetical protein D6775_04150, partial [Caldilineae bacterium]